MLAYFLPEWCPASTYVREAKALGLEDVRQVHLITIYFITISKLNKLSLWLKYFMELFSACLNYFQWLYPDI